MQGPRTAATAWAIVQGIEAAQMIRKGQVLGITRSIRVDKPGYSVRFWESCKNDIADGQSALVIAQMQH